MYDTSRTYISLIFSEMLKINTLLFYFLNIYLTILTILSTLKEIISHKKYNFAFVSFVVKVLLDIKKLFHYIKYQFW